MTQQRERAIHAREIQYRSFDLTEVEPRLKPSALIKGDKKAAEAFCAKIPNVSEIAKPISTEEAERVFNAWSASMNDAPPDTVNGGVEHGSNSGESPASGGASVDDVVAKLNGMISKKS